MSGEHLGLPHGNYTALVSLLSLIFGANPRCLHFATKKIVDIWAKGPIWEPIPQVRMRTHAAEE